MNKSTTFREFRLSLPSIHVVNEASQQGTELTLSHHDYRHDYLGAEGGVELQGRGTIMEPFVNAVATDYSPHFSIAYACWRQLTRGIEFKPFWVKFSGYHVRITNEGIMASDGTMTPFTIKPY